MKISSMIKKNFFSLKYDDTLSFAAKKLVEKGIPDAIVLKNGKFAGIFATSDLASAIFKSTIFARPKEADAKKVKDEIVGKHLMGKNIWLHSDADIFSAFMQLLHNDICVIPVLDSKKSVLGVLDVSDLRQEMVRLLKAGDLAPAVGVPVENAREKSDTGTTTIDKVFYFVQNKGVATADEVAKNCNLSVPEVESYANSLEKHGLVKIEYNLFGKLKIYKIGEK